ncbi:Lrp/AsnC family transcriptional regulator [Bordetella petrii]|uniref:siroheme decarboxylase subunit beta n=1 Tax=Bordetella petrii TaxID=94624 RepID=UPI00372F26E0
MNVLLTAEQKQRLRRLIEPGLPLTERPYHQLAEQLGTTERAVLAQMRRWNDAGLFRRVGLVVNHRALGFLANAMLVLDVPDDRVDAAGRLLGQAAGVNLCYQRPRRPPRWRYNLFCMVHGRQQAEVRRHIDRLLHDLDLADLPHELLFSTRAYKQCGGRYAPAGEHRHG